ncbi:hypothetical protein K501DRAFT_218157 [Backusella circina FSU 941]|nr:hypothetical protein K501DRAFT_218157 [Backusella circina FSU 941]
MSHLFTEKTFSHLTYCDNCKQLLWGLVKQGVECTECSYKCHRKCKASATACPSEVSSRFLDDDNHSNKSSRAMSYLRSLQQHQQPLEGSVQLEEATPSNTMETNKDFKVNKSSSTLGYIHAITSSDKLHTILATAAENEEEPINAYLANQPALNPQLTAKNFTRFVSRCGPVFAFRNKALLLLSWENPIDTLVVLILYCLVCLYPKLLLFAPQAILTYIIIASYPKKDTSQNQSKKKKTKIDSSHHQNTENPSKSKSSDTSSNPSKKGNTHTSSGSYMFPFNISNLFQPASDESPEYVRNLQNIQNTMGEYSDVYDWIVSKSNHVNWTSEDETMRILQFIIGYSLLLFVITYAIPLNILFLMLGVSVFMVNTQSAKHVVRELKPYLIQSSKRKVQGVKEWYENMEERLENMDNLEEITVYENQRWSPMEGYLHKMLNGDRTAWSNFTGTVEMPLITEIPPPEGYEWKEDSEWNLDKTGPWIDDYLGIEITVLPDDNGWIYCDTNWNISCPQIEPVDNGRDQHKETVTRMRRWVRKCDKIH